MDFDQCPCSGKSLARLIQPAVMAALAAGEPLHGYVILQRLRGMAMFRDQGPDATGLYRLLHTMEQDGLVSAAWDVSARGPAKRRYALTADGRACLGRWVGTLRTYQAAIGDLLATAAEHALAPAPRPRRTVQPAPAATPRKGR